MWGLFYIEGADVMKRKYGDGSSWKRLLEKDYTVKRIEEGMLGILEIKR